MAKDLDLIIKATQVSLGRYVKRPPLSEKLLKKPPFRFLHDIVTSVLKSTGFFDGLFEEHELISDNVKDREDKVLFLNKIIFVIGKTTGKDLLVKSSKIVAGQEPEKTNELLQSLAEALDKNLSSKEAVVSFKESTDSNRNITKGSKTIKTLSKIKDKSTKIDKNKSSAVETKLKEDVKYKGPPSKNTLHESKLKTKDKLEKNIKNTKGNAVKDLNQVTNKNISPPLEENLNINRLNHPLKEPSEHKNVNIEENTSEGNTILIQSTQSDEQTNIKILNESPKINDTVEENTNGCDTVSPEENQNEKFKEIFLTESALENPDKYPKMTINEDKNEYSIKNTEDESQINTRESQSFEHSVLRPSSVRPSSSRPGAPKVRDKQDNNIPSGDNIIISKVNIIAENTLNEEDEESSIVIENATEIGFSQENEEHHLANHRGHLVQQILDSQKEFTRVVGKTDIEWQFGSQKARDDVNKNIEQLRFNVQAVSRVANPLGKLLDHVQEDVEVMRQELQQWIQIYQETTKELSKQKALTEESMLPLQSKIKQLDTDILEKQQKITDLKIMVYKNNSRIEKLLENGNVQ